MEANKNITPEYAYFELWNQGIVNWVLRDHQRELYDSYINCQEKTVVFNCSRRLGKSFVLCVIALETCLKKPNSLVKYCCAKQVDAKGIIRPLIREILDLVHCPKELKPKFKTQDRAWVFANGSRIELSGLDGGRAESVRGGSVDVAIIDEAGLVSDLKYIIRSIILPTTTTTKGKIILASTPPKTSSHPFVDFINRARIQGNLVTKDIYSNKSIDPEELQKIIDECGGTYSTDFRREYLCQIILDSEFAVLPEFTPELKTKIVKSWPKAVFYDAYVSMDLGMRDLTVALFAWYDFRAAKLIIEDEFVINGQKFNTKTLAEGIKNKETEHFSDKVTGEQKVPLVRVSDNNLIVINDLYQLHGLRFFATRKDDKDSALNTLRIQLENEKIIINPRCKILIQHLETAVWNKSKTSFERSADGSHYDGVDSLLYLNRNIQLQKNPYPANFGILDPGSLFEPTIKPSHPQYSQFNKILNLKNK